MNTPNTWRNKFASSRCSASTPSGTPSAPPMTNGQSRRNSMSRRYCQMLTRCSVVAQIEASSTICAGGSAYSHTPVTTIANANPALPTTNAARNPPTAISARSSKIQCKRESSDDADAGRDCQQTLLPVAPRQKFEHKQAHAAGHVSREQNDKTDFSELDQRLLRPL